MTLKEIHDRVRAALARGNTLDESIPGMVKQAAMWIERNQSYTHMERFVSKEPGYAADRKIELPSKLVKNIMFLRVVSPSGYRYLSRADPRQQKTPGRAGHPCHYWRASEKYLMLDASVEQATLELAWYSYTDWPVRDTDSNWLIMNAADALVAQTMILFAGELMTPGFRSLYQPQRDEALRTLHIAQEDEQYSDSNMVMRFS